MLIYDKKQGKVLHYQSDPAHNILDFFNTKCTREFYTNKDYVRVGGRQDDFNGQQGDKNEAGGADLADNDESEQVQSVMMLNTVDGVSKKGQ